MFSRSSAAERRSQFTFTSPLVVAIRADARFARDATSAQYLARSISTAVAMANRTGFRAAKFAPRQWAEHCKYRPMRQLGQCWLVAQTTCAYAIPPLISNASSASRTGRTSWTRRICTPCPANASATPTVACVRSAFSSPTSCAQEAFARVTDEHRAPQRDGARGNFAIARDCARTSCRTRCLDRGRFVRGQRRPRQVHHAARAR